MAVVEGEGHRRPAGRCVQHLAHAAHLKAGVAGRRAAPGASVARVAQLESAQVRIEELLTAPQIGARVQYRTQRVFNGVAVFVEPSKVDAIRALPGVKSVKPLALHAPANATSVPFLLRLRSLSSGVMFPRDKSSHRIHGPMLLLVELNPFAAYLTLYRWSFLGLPLTGHQLAVAIGWSVFALVWGFRFFRRAELRSGRG